jgi:radical SAM superfamily enzyme YgiQ (UPF0313 family)
VASALKKNGHEVHLIDCLLKGYTYARFLEETKSIDPDIIGINLYSIAVPFVRRMIGMVKVALPETIVVLGGPHVSSLPERVLNDFPGADFAIRGEGEVPASRLIGELARRGSQFEGIPGLIYRDKGAVRCNEPYFAGNVDDYGFPDWDLIGPSRYFRYLGVGAKSVPVFFSRGCPFPCTFCAARVTSGQALRRRSIAHIFSELRLLRTKYGIKRFIIEDEGFGVEKKFIMEFCAQARAEDFRATFAMGLGMRLDIVDEELLTRMRQSGFEKTLVLGIESGSQRILDLMKKRINLEMIRVKVDLMDRMGLAPNGFFILGYPGETRAEMEQTIRLALDLKIREASFTAFQPLPGTEATRMLMERGELPSDYDFTLLASGKVVYAPQGMTTGELEQVRKNAIQKFYLRPKIIVRYFRSWRLFLYAVQKFYAIFFRRNAV